MPGEKAKIYFTDLEIGAQDFAHQVWRQAEGIPLNKYWSGIDAAGERHAEARLMFSPGALLVRFECEQSEPLIINDKLFLTQKTIGLWEKDVCELFIAPGSETPERYFEFEAAPTGEWLDLKIRQMADKREVDWTYDSGMSCAALVSGNKVIIAMRIPWEAFGQTPAPGDIWRGNLFRCVGVGENRGYLAWQPTLTPGPNFHVPGAFGWFEFVK